jgi:hypothetical protein
VPPRLALALLALVLVWSAAASAARTKAAVCKAACGATITKCVGDGYRPRKCARTIRRSCRKYGIEVCAATEAPSGTLAVAPTGTDVSGCGTTDAPCATIQFAIDTLVPRGTSGTIKVAIGTYGVQMPCDAGTGADHAVVCVIDRHVTLIGGFVPPDWDAPTTDPAATVIDANGGGRGVVAVRSSAAQIVAGIEMQGFTIQNGLARGKDKGDESATWAFGGGMLGGNCPIVLRHITFRANVALGGAGKSGGGRGSGGALALTGNQGDPPPTATLQDVTFDSNAAQGGVGADAGGYALGGGLFAFGYAIDGDRLVLTGNTATAGSSSGPGIAGSDKADALGGAMAASLGSVVTLRHLRAEGNVATGGDAPNGDGGGSFGGALFAELAAFTLSDAIVAGNHAHGGSGRNDLGGSSIAQGGAMMATTSALTLDRVVVRGNEATAGDGVVHAGIPEGGGVAMTAAARDGVALPFVVRNALIAGNVVSVGAGRIAGGGGGGLWVQGATGTVEHATIADNELGEPHLLGAGIGILPLAGVVTSVAFKNTIFANHTSPATQPGVYTNAALWVAENGAADVAGALFAGNVHDSNAGIWDVLNVPSGMITLLAAHTAVQAGFVSPAAPDFDYHLSATSPAVDAATASAVGVDLDGAVRPAGAGADLGAFERQP